MRHSRGLTIDKVEKFYDEFGTRQDQQGYFEDKTFADLMKHARFDEAQAIVELGCRTGHYAEQLLVKHLPSQATY